MSSKASKKNHSAHSTGLFAGMRRLEIEASKIDEHREILLQEQKEFAAIVNEANRKSNAKKYMAFWMDFEGQNLFDQYIDMSYLSDEFEDANFYLVDADSKYDAARQFVTEKFNALVNRGKRSEIQRMCLEYIFEELSEGDSIQVEGKIGHIISAIENLMEAFDIDDSDGMDEIIAFFKDRNIAELMTPEVELELFIKANIMNVAVLELKVFQE